MGLLNSFFLSLSVPPSSQVCPAVALAAFQTRLGGIKVKLAQAERKDKGKEGGRCIESFTSVLFLFSPQKSRTYPIPGLHLEPLVAVAVVKVTLKPGSVLRDQSLRDTFIPYQLLEES